MAEDPKRFVAFDAAGNRIAESNEPKEVQDAAEEYLADKKEAVHLYQHVFSMVPSDGG